MRHPATTILSGLGSLTLLACQPASSPLGLLTELTQDAYDTAVAPAIGALAVSCAGGIETAQLGQARSDAPSPLAADARFNIGSNAKSMLATLAAVFVADGHLDWDTTVADILTVEAGTLDPHLRNATLAQLLSHRSGLAAYSSGAELSALHPEGDSPQAQRLDAALSMLREPATYEPGSRFLYSNAGYVVVGAMLERVGGASVEELMEARVFRPLGMRDARFGDAHPGETGQPLGHYISEGALTVYLDNDPVIPLFLRPAGDVSLSLDDYGLYLREHLCGLQASATRLLDPALIEYLHAPQGEENASLGWGQYSFGGNPASVHVGGTGTFSAYVAILPGADLAVATVVNSGAPEAGQAALSLMQAIISARTEG